MLSAAAALQMSRAIAVARPLRCETGRRSGAAIEVGVRVIRLFSFVAARRGFDAVLRGEMIPELRAMPDLVDSYVGRQESDGPRIVVTVWDSRAAMVDGVGDTLGVFHPEYLDATTGQALEILDVRASWQRPSEDPRILRILRGEVRAGAADEHLVADVEVRAGELDVYATEVERGVEQDAKDERGPTALYLGHSDGPSFVTVSAWREWSDIERATGGNINLPRATSHPERLTTWEVEHFEIV